MFYECQEVVGTSWTKKRGGGRRRRRTWEKREWYEARDRCCFADEREVDDDFLPIFGVCIPFHSFTMSQQLEYGSFFHPRILCKFPLLFFLARKHALSHANIKDPRRRAEFFPLFFFSRLPAWLCLWVIVLLCVYLSCQRERETSTPRKTS